ncbi:MAG: 30S ribosomal protein S14 [Nanoarchaeota archaeon]
MKQLSRKKAVAEKFVKHNKPKDRKIGIAAWKCERCGRFGARVSSYGLNLCRHCFRQVAEEIGFQKYS